MVIKSDLLHLGGAGRRGLYMHGYLQEIRY